MSLPDHLWPLQLLPILSHVHQPQELYLMLASLYLLGGLRTKEWGTKYIIINFYTKSSWSDRNMNRAVAAGTVRWVITWPLFQLPSRRVNGHSRVLDYIALAYKVNVQCIYHSTLTLITRVELSALCTYVRIHVYMPWLKKTFSYPCKSLDIRIINLPQRHINIPHFYHSKCIRKALGHFKNPKNFLGEHAPRSPEQAHVHSMPGPLPAIKILPDYLKFGGYSLDEQYCY